MSMRVVKEIVFVAMGDELFRQDLVFNPDETLSRYDLTLEEMKALRTGDKEKLVALGLEKGFAEHAYLLFSKRR